MQFRVIGHRRDNAARVTLEFEAESKAAAERDALKQDIEIVRVELVQGGNPPAVPSQPPPRPAVGTVRTHTPQPTRRRIPLAPLLLLLLAAAAAAWYFWPTLQPLIPRFK
jgi:hypothetical protein